MSASSTNHAGPSATTGGDLSSLMPTHADADRPWLVWYSPTERIELTGHVLAMWAAKTAGLLTAEAGCPTQVDLCLPGGWRAVTWCLGSWLTGSAVHLHAPHSASPAGWEPTVSAATRPGELLESADTQVLVPHQSLAVRWQGDDGAPAPALVLDGVADVMTYSDYFTPAHQPRPDDTAWVDPASGTLRSRADLAETVARRSLAMDAHAAATQPRALLITATDPAAAVVDVLAAWALRRTAVLLAPDCPPRLRATAAHQEEGVETP